MATSVYIVLHIVAVSSHFFSMTLSSQLFFTGIFIPVIDLIVKIIRQRKLTLSTALISTCFLTISIINYYTFSYHNLPYKYWMWGIVLICVLLEVITNYERIKKIKVRFITFCVLSLVPVAHSTMSHIQLLYFYTLGNPLEAEIRPKRLSAFAYLHYKQGEKDKAIMYLNKAKEVVSNDFYNNPNTDKKKLRQTYNRIEKDMLLLLQDKWIIEGKFDE